MCRLLLAFSLLAACAAPAPEPPPEPLAAAAPMPAAQWPEGLRLRVEPASAAPVSEVALVLENHRRDRVGYNLCMSGLERQDGPVWRPVPLDGACTRELRTVGPGGTARFAKRLPAGASRGTYRFTTRVEAPLMGPDRQQPIASETFEVR